MAVTVACLTQESSRKYRQIAEAMAAGITRCGDRAVLVSLSARPVKADVAVMYGWRRRQLFSAYPQFVYADLGYWKRDEYFRLSVGAWSPERYVSCGLSRSRFDSFGLEIKPWQRDGSQIVVAGSTRKAMTEHGFAYMGWEKRVIEDLRRFGKPIIYRPKPTDPEACPIPGTIYDRGAISETLKHAYVWVTHHSNSAVDALLAGVPVHCETGAAATMSIPLSDIGAPPLNASRERFIFDVAWLQWTLLEMRSGAAWAHLKERGLLC